MLSCKKHWGQHANNVKYTLQIGGVSRLNAKHADFCDSKHKNIIMIWPSPPPSPRIGHKMAVSSSEQCNDSENERWFSVQNKLMSPWEKLTGFDLACIQNRAEVWSFWRWVLFFTCEQPVLQSVWCDAGVIQHMQGRSYVQIFCSKIVFSAYLHDLRIFRG